MLVVKYCSTVTNLNQDTGQGVPMKYIYIRKHYAVFMVHTIHKSVNLFLQTYHISFALHCLSIIHAYHIIPTCISVNIPLQLGMQV